MPVNTGFYPFDKKHTPVNVKYKPKKKYEKKVLVWLDILAKGISRSFICTTKSPAITADLYVKECLSKLFLFIKTYHSHVLARSFNITLCQENTTVSPLTSYQLYFDTSKFDKSKTNRRSLVDVC